MAGAVATRSSSAPVSTVRSTSSAGKTGPRMAVGNRVEGGAGVAPKNITFSSRETFGKFRPSARGAALLKSSTIEKRVVDRPKVGRVKSFDTPSISSIDTLLNKQGFSPLIVDVQAVTMGNRRMPLGSTAQEKIIIGEADKLLGRWEQVTIGKTENKRSADKQVSFGRTVKPKSSVEGQLKRVRTDIQNMIDAQAKVEMPKQSVQKLDTKKVKVNPENVSLKNNIRQRVDAMMHIKKPETRKPEMKQPLNLQDILKNTKPVDLPKPVVDQAVRNIQDFDISKFQVLARAPIATIEKPGGTTFDVVKAAEQVVAASVLKAKEQPTVDTQKGMKLLEEIIVDSDQKKMVKEPKKGETKPMVNKMIDTRTQTAVQEAQAMRKGLEKVGVSKETAAQRVREIIQKRYADVLQKIRQHQEAQTYLRTITKRADDVKNYAATHPYIMAESRPVDPTDIRTLETKVVQQQFTQGVPVIETNQSLAQPEIQVMRPIEEVKIPEVVTIPQRVVTPQVLRETQAVVLPEQVVDAKAEPVVQSQTQATVRSVLSPVSQTVVHAATETEAQTQTTVVAEPTPVTQVQYQVISEPEFTQQSTTTIAKITVAKPEEKQKDRVDIAGATHQVPMIDPKNSERVQREEIPVAELLAAAQLEPDPYIVEQIKAMQKAQLAQRQRRVVKQVQVPEELEEEEKIEEIKELIQQQVKKRELDEISLQQQLLQQQVKAEVPEVDPDAYKHRWLDAEQAVERALQEAQQENKDGEAQGVPVTAVLNKMTPPDEQPTNQQSKIVQGYKDFSIIREREALAQTGYTYSKQDFMNRVRVVFDNIPPVQLSASPVRPVGQEEVEKVVKPAVLVFSKENQARISRTFSPNNSVKKQSFLELFTVPASNVLAPAA